MASTTTSTSRPISAVSLALRLSLIFLQLVVKSLQTDTQHLSSAGLIVAGKSQRFENQPAFRLSNRHPRAKMKIIPHCSRCSLSKISREIIALQDLSLTQNHH